MGNTLTVSTVATLRVRSSFLQVCLKENSQGQEIYSCGKGGADIWHSPGLYVHYCPSLMMTGSFLEGSWRGMWAGTPLCSDAEAKTVVAL